MKAPTPCLEAGCHGHVTKQGYCDQHQKPWVGTTRKQRLPGDWRTRRLIVLKRDQGICYLCGQPGADTVDHVVQGDDHSLENLKAVHDRVPPNCHRFKTAQDNADINRGNRIRRRI